MAYQYYGINDNGWCGPFDPNKNYVGVVCDPLGWNGFNFLAYLLCYYMLTKLENDVEPRVDAEKMKEENDLIAPLLII